MILVKNRIDNVKKLAKININFKYLDLGVDLNDNFENKGRFYVLCPTFKMLYSRSRCFLTKVYLEFQKRVACDLKSVQMVINFFFVELLRFNKIWCFRLFSNLKCSNDFFYLRSFIHFFSSSFRNTLSCSRLSEQTKKSYFEMKKEFY